MSPRRYCHALTLTVDTRRSVKVKCETAMRIVAVVVVWLKNVVVRRCLCLGLCGGKLAGVAIMHFLQRPPIGEFHIL